MIQAAEKGEPPVAALAKRLVQQSTRDGIELSPTDRQFAGSVVRFRMNEAGFQKTSKRGAVDCPPFTRAQMYQQAVA